VLNPREEAVRQYILTQYPLLGRAPGCQEIATALGLNGPGDVRTILERLHEWDLLYLDSDSREIRLAYPFSMVPTKHLVWFRDWPEAKPVYAACAVDALGIPFMMDRDVSIESSCAYCAMPVVIKMRDRSIESCIPAETVVWVGTAYRGHAATSLCPTMDFLCSPAHAAAWREARPQEEGHVLSVGEALYLGKGIFEDFLRPPPGAVSSVSTTAPPSVTATTATTASTAGGLLAAFLASICCIGPVVFAALGVGVGATGFLADTADFLKMLLPYRLLMIGLTMAFLGYSFYFAYRKPAIGHAACQTCVPVSGARQNRLLLWIIAGLAVALVLAPYWLELAIGS
jgi:mercuric ion transport protein